MNLFNLSKYVYTYVGSDPPTHRMEVSEVGGSQHKMLPNNYRPMIEVGVNVINAEVILKCLQISHQDNSTVISLTFCCA